jgi:SagB-type dehydrogenase family enzyme
MYHFHAADRVLEPLGAPVAFRDLIPDLMNQHFLAEAAVLLFFTAVFPRTLEKYGARGYRYVLIEAGHVAQNVCLLAAELGLSAVCVGGFTDRRINRLLKLDERFEGAVYALAVGHPHTTDTGDETHNGS